MTIAEQLWDIEQIKQLKARYFRLLDTKDWGAFADLFTEDCLHYLPQPAPTAAVGNEDYLRGLKAQLADHATVHHGHMPEITLVSETEAEGIWSMFDYVEADVASGHIRLQGYGHYFETYRKAEDGRWRISSKRNVRLRVDNLPTD